MPPERYRKIPVVIEAIQFRGNQTSALEIAKWTAGRCEPRFGTPNWDLIVRSPSGAVVAVKGDWIIKGVQPGDFYPCNNETFLATYEGPTNEEPLRLQAPE